MRIFKSLFIIGLISFGLFGQAALSEPLFESFIGYSVGSYPIGIASADFNGDTNPDVVTANNAASTVSVLLGNGDGSFATRVNYSTGASLNPCFVTTGDMDGDGQIDIITGGSMGIVIYYGVGDGTFGTANVYNFGEQVLDVIVADFDNDTHLDIATSHAVRDSVGIHINNDDSTYATHMVATGNGTVSLATGNLDADNYVDILVGCSQGTVWNLKNDQSGSFVPTEVHIGNLSDPASVAITDLNGDNIGDFGVTHAVNDFLFTYLNNGDGTYTIDKSYVLTDNPTNFEFADINNDSMDDVLICVGSTNEIEIYLNQGSRVFGLDTAYTVGGTPKGLVFEDFDDDGYSDLVVTSYTTDMAAVLINRLSLILSIDEINSGNNLPNDFSLEQNYPNPFNPITKIRFSLPVTSQVKVEVFNILGQSVRDLIDEKLTAGTKEVSWDGLNNSGAEVSSGIYFYKIVTENFEDTKKMVLLK
ncbi:MAG: T9SS type A sorting domain-containing protein [candidate division Zixibacteria bacterium]|nr:T9SS type A sorting domain-containing protein [candidate division Zixibacteria bacterium]